MSPLERKLAGKSNKIPRYSGIDFSLAFIERGTFNEVHVNMVCLYF
jgi:hypothetical protein